MELPCYVTKPRHNGSHDLRECMKALEAHLRLLGIVPRRQPFTLYPYFMESLGLWLATGGLLLPFASVARAGWVGLLLGLFIAGIPLLEVYFLVPTVTALIRRQAYNLFTTCPAVEAAQEVILCAHMDSKTEILDHRDRQVLLRLAMPAAVLAITSGILDLTEQLVRPAPAAGILRWTAFSAALPACFYGLLTAANLVLGRVSKNPSQGAVDNGAAVTVLVRIADLLHRHQLRLDRTSVTVLWTVGEEAQMQGALAWVRQRHDWPTPAFAVNLEILGQNGSLVLWERDGTALRRLATSAELNAGLGKAIQSVTGVAALRASDISSDAFALLSRQIPATTMGSFDAEKADRGLHSHHDNPDRVAPSRLDEALAVLSRFLTDTDRRGMTSSTPDPSETI